MRDMDAFGNRCGHDPRCFRRYTPAANHQPRILEEARSRIGECLGGYWDQLWDGNRQRRSERREACGLLLACLIHRMDLATLKVGFPQADGRFKGLTDRDLSRMTGLTLRRLERAMQDLSRMNIIRVKTRCERQADGRYQGLAAIRSISSHFFTLMGLGSQLKREQKRALQRREDRYLAKASQKTFERMAEALRPQKTQTYTHQVINEKGATRGFEAIQQIRWVLMNRPPSSGVESMRGAL